MYDDSHYESCLSEASEFHMPPQLRPLFSSLLCFCSVSEPVQLWDKFKRVLAEDYIHRKSGEEEGVLWAYYDIMDRVCGANLMSLISPPSRERPTQLNEEEFAEDEHIACGRRLMDQRNVHQNAAADSILSSVDDDSNQHFFVDGPRSGGKTFLYVALYNTLLGMRNNVIRVAWTGLAAKLLPS
uniref:ATP-dependent DNA helicase n=1 Tax=Haemonchus placei TaxID=6290 RepID=A0A0N4WDV6_HAEPC